MTNLEKTQGLCEFISQGSCLVNVCWIDQLFKSPNIYWTKLCRGSKKKRSLSSRSNDLVEEIRHKHLLILRVNNTRVQNNKESASMQLTTDKEIVKSFWAERNYSRRNDQVGVLHERWFKFHLKGWLNFEWIKELGKAAVKDMRTGKCKDFPSESLFFH